MHADPAEVKLHSFLVKGMTCQQCVKRVRDAAMQIEGTEDAQVFLGTGKLLVWARPPWSEHLLQEAIRSVGYSFQPTGEAHAAEGAAVSVADPLQSSPSTSGSGSFPLFVTFANILAVAGWAAWTSSHEAADGWHKFMTFSMAGYFLVLGLFKVISLRKFVELFQRYDLLAKRSPGYAWAFPFLEWTAGWAYLCFPHASLLHGIVLVWMVLSAVGPLQVILRQDQIRCACLGEALGQPVGWVTVGENVAMALMAAAMLIF
jgi:cation transport ATPase